MSDAVDVVGDSVTTPEPLFETAEAALAGVGDALLGWGFYPGSGEDRRAVKAIQDALATEFPNRAVAYHCHGGDVRAGRLVIRTAQRWRGSLDGWHASWWEGKPLHGAEALIQILAPGKRPEVVGVPTRVLRWQWRARRRLWAIAREDQDEPAG